MATQENVLQVPFVDLKPQHVALAEEIDEAVSNVLKNTAFILGQDTRLLEEAFASYCSAHYAVGVDNGTSALELILRAYGIGPGDEVITVANTFIATTLAITHVGARPVLVDVDPVTYNIDVNQIPRVITARTRAIIPVHLYGQPADMDAINSIAEEHRLIVVEDACQAHGAEYRGRRTGSLGHAAAFSFYPSKNLGACGDAGMVVTNDEAVAETIRMLRNVGQARKYYHDLLGHNHRIDNLQSAILRVKLPHLDGWNNARRERAAQYNELLAGTGAETPSEASYTRHVYHLYVVQVDRRDEFQAYLSEHGVSTGIHYPVPIHLQKAYADLGYRRGDFPVTEAQVDRIVSLPMYAELSPEMVEYVADVIRNRPL
jgi:dTDP-4-amino-4,6-dideoxygalactose transaminase